MDKKAESRGNNNIYGQNSGLNNEYQGVSQSSKQEKKRKRPDDKKQKIGGTQPKSNGRDEMKNVSSSNTNPKLNDNSLTTGDK